jgi:hypothetical protein
MKRSPRQVGLVASTVLALTMALTVATASTASADPPDLSSDQAINAYLVSIGVDPAEAVWQRGLKNYAGPGCPGASWNCVRANAPIVQIGPAGGRNLFACGQQECVAVQVLLNGGQNASACERRVEGPIETVMVCDITQANGPGTNAAAIAQHIQQSKGVTQRAREIARITQVNETGSNIARIIQGIGQSSRSKSGDVMQTQEAHQAATVTQTTESSDLTAMLGDNTSNIRQTQNQLQRASGGSDLRTISQAQNTDPGSDPTCDQPQDATFQQKNQCANVTQHSGLINLVGPVFAPGGGDNSSILNHAITQRQIAERAGTVNQSQGAFSSGEEGIKDQLSSGVSTGTATQDMLQNQTAPSGLSFPALTQDQNTGDPRCCWNQLGNDANRADIRQTTLQTASSEDANQNATLVGTCTSSGTCHVEQSATTDDASDTNECTGSSCFVITQCFEGEGGEGFCTGGVD